MDDIFYVEQRIIPFRKKCKISHCGLSNLQFTLCGIKTNSEVHVVSKRTQKSLWYAKKKKKKKKNNLVPTVKFHQLT
jgi:hypothetical protein